MKSGRVYDEFGMTLGWFEDYFGMILGLFCETYPNWFESLTSVKQPVSLELPIETLQT